jgi:hypothetical protein
VGEHATAANARCESDGGLAAGTPKLNQIDFLSHQGKKPRFPNLFFSSVKIFNGPKIGKYSFFIH